MKNELEFFFHIENPDDYVVVDLGATSHGEIEVEIDGFIDPRIENILPAFLKEINMSDYIENHLPVLVMPDLKNK